MRIEIDRSEYRWTHGKDPRGFGGWMFDIISNNGYVLREMATGTYGDALKVAKATARRTGGRIIRVLG